MKNIKNLKIKTCEGFEVKNLQRFPSMEWGDEGGMSADIYYNGKHILSVFQAGDGGCAKIDYTEYGEQNLQTIIPQATAFLKRSTYRDLLDECDSANTYNQYCFYDEWEYLIHAIEEQYDKVKTIKKLFKKGYQAVAVVSDENEWRTLSSATPSLTESSVKSWMDKHNWEYSNIEIFTLETNLTTM